MDTIGDIALTESNGQTRIDWKISSFFSLSNNSYNSPDFVLSDSIWFFRVFPRFDERYTSLSLELKKATTHYRVEYRMGIKKCDGSDDETEKFVSVFKQKKREIIVCYLILKNILLLSKEDFIAEDCLTVFCKIRKLTSVLPSNTAMQIHSLSGIETMSENFKNLYLSKRFSDFKIIVKNKEFHAHKFVLAARSKVFSSMFEHDTTETRNGTVDISDCEPDTFEAFIMFLYTGDFNIITPKNAEILYKIADKYDLNDLKEECYWYMMDNLNEDSFCDTIRLAHMFDELDLLSAATRFFLANVKTIILTKAWQSLMAENPSLCNELFVKLVNTDKK